MKKCTIRVDSHIANSIIREGGNLTATCTAYVEAYYYVRQNGLTEIRKMFSLPELRLMLDAENGVSFCPAMISGFPGHIFDSMALDRLDQKWGVDRNELMSKLNAMSPTLMVVLEQWLNSYWYGKMAVRPPYDEYLKGK